jgi:hypothetical protein
VGARPAATFGPLTDRAVCRVMAADARPFVSCLTGLPIRSSPRGVAGHRRAEGYNPVHDVCHWIGRAATTRARAFGEGSISGDLVSHPDSSGDGLRIVLDDEAFAAPRLRPAHVAQG